MLQEKKPCLTAFIASAIVSSMPDFYMFTIEAGNQTKGYFRTIIISKYHFAICISHLSLANVISQIAIGMAEWLSIHW